MPSADRRVLVLACSRQKRPDPDPLPALARYDGPTFRVVRRYLQATPAPTLDVAIVSAEYGLIPADQPIPRYDRRMTPARAAALRPLALATLERLVQERRVGAVCLCLGRGYLAALDGYQAVVPPTVAVQIVAGASGLMLAQVHDWLYGQPPATLGTRSPRARPQPLRLRGVEVTVTAEDVLAAARTAPRDHQSGANRAQAWYILVDGQRVSPKWLVSQLTGLPMAAFHSDDARRLLGQLGLEVRRHGLPPP